MPRVQGVGSQGQTEHGACVRHDDSSTTALRPTTAVELRTLLYVILRTAHDYDPHTCDTLRCALWPLIGASSAMLRAALVLPSPPDASCSSCRTAICTHQTHAHALLRPPPTLSFRSCGQLSTLSPKPVSNAAPGTATLRSSGSNTRSRIAPLSPSKQTRSADTQYIMGSSQSLRLVSALLSSQALCRRVRAPGYPLPIPGQIVAPLHDCRALTCISHRHTETMLPASTRLCLPMQHPPLLPAPTCRCSKHPPGPQLPPPPSHLPSVRELPDVGGPQRLEGRLQAQPEGRQLRLPGLAAQACRGREGGNGGENEERGLRVGGVRGVYVLGLPRGQGVRCRSWRATSMQATHLHRHHPCCCCSGVVPLHRAGFLRWLPMRVRPAAEAVHGWCRATTRPWAAVPTVLQARLAATAALPPGVLSTTLLCRAPCPPPPPPARPHLRSAWPARCRWWPPPAGCRPSASRRTRPPAETHSAEAEHHR